MALDDHAFAADAAFHHVGIDGALDQKVHLADLFGFFFKNTDEFFSDDLAFTLGIGDALQTAQKPILRVDTDDLDAQNTHGLHHLIALVFAQQAVIHKDTGQLIAHRPVEKGGSHRAVHAAAQRQQHLAAAHLGAAFLDGLLGIRGHFPFAFQSADAVEEVFQYLCSVDRVKHLGVELNAVKLPLGILYRGGGAARRVRAGAESRRQRFYLDPVAHPKDRGFLDAVKQGAALMGQLDLAVFPHGGKAAVAAQKLHHQLLPVADAENGDAQRKNAFVDHGRAFVKDGGGAAGENDPIGGKGGYRLRRDRPGLNLAVNAALAHAPRYQQIVLAAEIQYQNTILLFHIDALVPKILYSLF